MSDTTTTIETLKNNVKKFVEDREWHRFHSPKSLSMAIVSESTELMNIFLWSDNAASHEVLEKKRQEVEAEIADIVYMVLAFCTRYNIDLDAAMAYKQVENTKKYPIEKCKGTTLKYNQL